MTTLGELFGDFDIALERVRVSFDEDEVRRALSEALNTIYIVREHRKKEAGSKDAYFAAVRSGHDYGKVTEGLVAVRDIATHDFTKAVAPVLKPLYPGENVYPSEDLYPGMNLTWLDIRELSDVSADRLQERRDQAEYYGALLARRLVATTLREAQQYLAGAADKQ